MSGYDEDDLLRDFQVAGVSCDDGFDLAWVDSDAGSIFRALIRAGWTPPRREET